MSSLDWARQYLDAWNAHDADAIVRTFAAGGTYTDPTTGTLSGDAIGANARHLWAAFPDLGFDIASLAEAGAGRVMAEWIMKGTNTGAFLGLPATKRPISLPGVDVMEVGAVGIRSVTGYFDTRAMPEQLGLQVLIQPFTIDLRVGKAGTREAVPERRHPRRSHAQVLDRAGRCGIYERVASRLRESAVGPVQGVPQDE